MTEQYCDLVVTGVKDAAEFPAIKEQLAKLYKTDSSQFDCLIDGSPTTLHKQLPLSSAEKVKSTLEKLGLTCTLEPCWELVEKEPGIEMYRCPAW